MFFYLHINLLRKSKERNHTRVSDWKRTSSCKKNKNKTTVDTFEFQPSFLDTPWMLLLRASALKYHPLFFLSLIPISSTCCQWLWNVNHPLKAISVWYVAPHYSEEHLHSALLHHPPSTASSTDLHSHSLLCMFLCVWVFVPVWHESTPAPHRSDETRTKRVREPGRDGKGEQLEEGAGT